jgi:radical SAM protein with 4Fe4S-binding SPASM domain
LADLGVRQVSLIGGEAYLRRDWIEIVAAISRHQMDCSIQTGGRGLTREMLKMAAEAGLKSCGVSIDGLAPLHDRLRGVLGSYAQAMRVLADLRSLGIPSSVNTQIGAETISQLHALLDRIADVGVRNWQIQLTVPMGNAADRPELLLQPYQLLELMPLLAELHEAAEERDVLMQPTNTIGYFGPFEHRWRITDETRGHWQGCAAGQTAMGLEADGTIKGCPSLPTKAYGGGSVREHKIADLWRNSERLRVTRESGAEGLWGYCRRCYYADVCRGGCTWMSHVLFGRPGNNPYCHYRTLELARQGLRESLKKVSDAPGDPFDHGVFEIVLERLDGGRAGSDESPDVLDVVPRSARSAIPARLEMCRGCFQYVYPGTETCPHCGGCIAELDAQYAAALAEALDAADSLRKLIEDDTAGPSSDS